MTRTIQLNKGEKMKFKSKNGVSLYIMLVFCALLMAGSIVPIFFLSQIWLIVTFALIAVFIALTLVVFLIPGLTDTYYEFADDHLLVKSGRFYKQEVPYSRITKVTREVKSLLQQPAGSFVRVEIMYKLQSGASDVVHVSPVNEDEFVNLLEARISV